MKLTKGFCLLSIVVSVVFGIGFFSLQQVDAGSFWTKQTGAGARYWYGVASSADGMKLAAIDSTPGYIYTSTDGGVTWAQHTANEAPLYWQSIASSADGTKLAAAVNGGYIYTSNDGGSTWATSTNAGNRYWQSIASSADGTKLAATDGYGAYIYTSTDSGATWTEHTDLGQKIGTQLHHLQMEANLQ